MPSSHTILTICASQQTNPIAGGRIGVTELGQGTIGEGDGVLILKDAMASKLKRMMQGKALQNYSEPRAARKIDWLWDRLPGFGYWFGALIAGGGGPCFWQLKPYSHTVSVVHEAQHPKLATLVACCLAMSMTLCTEACGFKSRHTTKNSGLLRARSAPPARLAQVQARTCNQDQLFAMNSLHGQALPLPTFGLFCTKQLPQDIKVLPEQTSQKDFSRHLCHEPLPSG